MKYLILIITALVFGCTHVTAKQTTGFTPAYWTGDRCQTLLDQRDALLWAVAFGGSLAGAGGISTAVPEDDHRNARIALGISTAVIAAAATSASVLAKIKSTEFERYCNVEEPPLELAPEVVPESMPEPTVPGPVVSGPTLEPMIPESPYMDAGVDGGM